MQHREKKWEHSWASKCWNVDVDELASSSVSMAKSLKFRTVLEVKRRREKFMEINWRYKNGWQKNGANFDRQQGK